MSLPVKVPEGAPHKKLKASTEGTAAYEYLQTLHPGQWQKITVRNTAKGVLTSFYHFANVWIWNKAIDWVDPRLLVIRKTYTLKGEEEIKYSFTNANLAQYTPQGLPYMQA